MHKKFTIKLTALLLVFLISLSFKSNATEFTVNVANFSFTPKTIPNVIVGDVIKFVWVSGSHTTTCDPATNPGNFNSLPDGAVTWDSPMNTASTTFSYTVTVAGIYNYSCIPHQDGGMVGSFTASAALPVKLSGFNVLNENNNPVLRWTTESEENTDYFSIQKSKTGSDFTEIAKIPAAGNSSEIRSYTYTDPNPSSTDEFSYYNIGIVDKDGKKEFSPVGLFKNKLSISKLIIALSPNPVSQSGHIMLKFNADKTSKMDVRVFNMEGKSVLQTTMQAYEGVNNGHLMLGNIPAGSYSVSFELNGTKEVYKLIVK